MRFEERAGFLQFGGRAVATEQGVLRGAVEPVRSRGDELEEQPVRGLVAGECHEREVRRLGAVVPHRECGVQVRAADDARPIPWRVGNREPEQVGFRSGHDRPVDAGRVVGDRVVNLGPVLLGIGVADHARDLAGVFETFPYLLRERLHEVVVQVATRWQLADPTCGDEEAPIREPVGDLDIGEVLAQLLDRDVAHRGDVRVGRS